MRLFHHHLALRFPYFVLDFTVITFSPPDLLHVFLLIYFVYGPHTPLPTYRAWILSTVVNVVCLAPTIQTFNNYGLNE